MDKDELIYELLAALRNFERGYTIKALEHARQAMEMAKELDYLPKLTNPSTTQRLPQ